MVTHADEQHREFSTLAVLAQLTREKQLRVLDDYSRPQDAIQLCGIELIYPILVVEGELFQVSQTLRSSGQEDVTYKAKELVPRIRPGRKLRAG
jgi:hypothetical protein